MAYTIYEKKKIHVLPHAVAIAAVGRISLNASLTRMFREKAVESALLLFDIKKRKVALRTTTKTDVRSYSITYTPDQAFICARSFLKEIGWDGRAYKIPAEWDEKESLLEFEIPRWGRKETVVPVRRGQMKAG
jgi:hypothetical protein